MVYSLDTKVEPPVAPVLARWMLNVARRLLGRPTLMSDNLGRGFNLVSSGQA